jgi:hypothetical protein
MWRWLQAMLHSRLRAALAGGRQHVDATRDARHHAMQLHLRAMLRLQHQVRKHSASPCSA